MQSIHGVTSNVAFRISAKFIDYRHADFFLHFMDASMTILRGMLT